MQVRKILSTVVTAAFMFPALVVGYVFLVCTEDGERTTLGQYLKEAESDPQYATYILALYAAFLAMVALVVVIFK